MCGIFAYTGSTPEENLLTAAAAEAGRRGPHGHGWVARYADGSTREHRQLGALNGDLKALVGASAAVAVLGHARLATVGDWADETQLQPVTCGGHAIAHNGTIYNVPAVIPGTLPQTDTAALAFYYMLARNGGCTPEKALQQALDVFEQISWAIVILDRDGQLIAHRHTHPLYEFQAPWGAYLSSRPFAPGCQLMPEDKIVVVDAMVK